MYGFLADLVVAVHVGYVGYVVVGQLLILIGWMLGWSWVRNFWFRATHVLAMAVVVFEEIQDIRCPYRSGRRASRPRRSTDLRRNLHGKTSALDPLFTMRRSGFSRWAI